HTRSDRDWSSDVCSSDLELAARMQVEALKVADIDQESEATRKLYGIDAKIAGPFSRLCLMARRLAERDVRFIQVYGGGGGNWDRSEERRVGKGGGSRRGA